MSIVLLGRKMFGEVGQTRFYKINDFTGIGTYRWVLGSALRDVTQVKDSIYPSKFFHPCDNILGRYWLISLDLINSELSIEAFKPPPEGTNVKFVFSIQHGDKEISVAAKFNESEIGKCGGHVLCKVAPDFWDSCSKPINQLKKVDVVTINCNVTYHFPKTNLTQLMALAKDLNVLRKGKTADVVLCVRGADGIPAHSAILSARSKVFAKMFTHNMSEKKTGRVNIKDVEPDVMKALLDFMYCANIDAAMDVYQVFKLRRAADKYDMADLQNVCDDFVISRMNVGNAIAFSLSADEYDASDVKKLATEFISQNYTRLDFQRNRDMIRDKSRLAIIDIMERFQIFLSTKQGNHDIS